MTETDNIATITLACSRMIAGGDADQRKLALKILGQIESAALGRRIKASKAERATKATKPRAA
jgi:hypothetical protein